MYSASLTPPTANDVKMNVEPKMIAIGLADRGSNTNASTTDIAHAPTLTAFASCVVHPSRTNGT